jgi:hypothetical protein
MRKKERYHMKQKLIALMLVLCSVGALLVPHAMAEEKPVSRIEWVQQLVKAFDMTVEENNYPDNYYSDMEETSAGYRDLLVAVEFGVIDLEAGSAFEPDQPATREFAAHTLNFCLGFQLDQGTAYTYAESAEVSYPDDLQVAVNRGWFALQDGKVLPQQTLTSTEATAMLKDAAAVIAGDKVDVGHNNSFTYESGVVEIPESTPVEINEDGTITVVNLPAAVKVGTTFVIYRGGFPKGYKAVSIREDGQTSVLTVEKVALDSILSSADAEGRVQGDLADFEPADGVDIAYIFSDGSETTDRTQAARATKHIKDIVLNKTISGVAVSATLSELSLDYGLSGGPTTPVSARVILNGDASISSTIPFSAPASIELGYVPVGFFGSITITADIGVDGTITLSYGCSFSMGVSYSSMDGFRAIANFSKESFSLAANFNVHAGLKVAANITNLEFIYGTIYARIGAQCNYMVVPHSEPEYPDLCVGTDSWLYANVGLNVGVSCWKINKSYSKQIDIWSRSNSPIRTVSHLEDNVWVPSCTCDTTGVFGRYFTPINSRYYNDGRRDVVNMPTYTYTVDGNGNATITGYSGGVAALFIPETIDGHTVTAIGNRAFKGNLRLAAVTIPDTITEIGQDAFSGCTGLTSIKLPRNLKTLESDAFRDCTGLTSVLIPKTVENTHYYYDGIYSPFRGCNNLQEVKFEDGMTRIPNSILCFCAAKLNIVIPDSVTEIGEAAFLNSGIVAVTIPDTVTEIEEDAFRGCTGLTDIKLPDSVVNIGTKIFANCTSLTDVTLPNAWELIPASTFEGCTALEKLVLPESVKNIRDSAFKNCTALKELVWSKVPELIESNAFYNCDAITEMDIPATVTSVGYQAFYDCDGLTKITIPDSVTSLGDSVFYDCDALTDVKLGAGITTIPASAFRHCDALEQLTVPRRVTAIKDNAFKDSVKFSSITIPRSVTSISANAFSYLDKLTIYGVAGTYAETFAKTNSIKFVDRQVSATSASLDQTALTLNKGASGQLMLTVTPEDFTDEVVWKSSDTAVVTVSDTGLVKAVGVGTATIKVSVGKASASCKVTVLQPVTSISLNRSSLTMEATDTFQLQASVYPSNAADQRVQWTSSDPAVASVDENGLVTALKKGTSTVTAAALDGSGVTRTCQVTVSNTAYICTQPEQMESPHDYPDSCTDVWLYTSPGAQKLYVTFDERTRMEDGFDYLYIYDGNGQQIGKYTGTELAGTTVTVPGDMVKIQINSDGSGSEWGFKVTGIRAEASAVVVNPIGGDNAPACQVDGQTLTVTCDRACVAAYKDADGNYVRLIPTANANGSYSYTLPEGVAEVTVAVRGDLDGDGKLTAKEARRVMTAVTRADSLDALQMLCADLNGDGKISAMEARQVLSAVTNSASVKW